MKKYPDYDINNIIAELTKLYEKEVVNGFITSARYDLLLGYAITNKGAVIEGDRIKFMKEDTISRKGGMHIYTDPITELISRTHDLKMVYKKVEPDRDWQKDALKYCSLEFLRKFRSVEERLISEGKLWDLIAFAEHVPHANLDKIEERLIKEGNSLQLLAYAMDVKFSDKDKIRKALYDICMKDQEPGSRVDSETKRLHKEHYLQFRNMFGSGQKPSENE